jgi:hypothetical protein
MAEMDFSEFARKTLERADLLIRAVGIKTFSAVIRDTPVGDPDLWVSTKKDSKGRAKPPPGYVGGRLRGNWRCSLAMPDLTTFQAPKGAKTRKAYKNFPAVGEVLTSVSDTCNQGNRKKVLWLSNSLPYAYRIEYEGWSRQAPEGMVRRNVTRIQKIISGELGKLKSSS